uniref:DNA repair protein REV1 n=1 Tax=Amphimedon queenslandica TaxID=400682 RepID=A0A1X7UNS7_AMPQE
MAFDWEDHKSYMTVKRQKLQDQLEDVEGDGKIFSGVTIYVNGYTKPDADTLKEIICKHGGGYSYALTSRVSHVIATNLPTAKIKALSINSSKVCHPDWILDSVNAGSLLPTEKYELYSVSSKSQRKISFSPTAKKEAGPEDPPTKKDRSFVDEFYSHSRLHHLSTWASELKEFTSKNLPRAKRKFSMLSSGESLRRFGVKGVVHLDLDSFFVSVGLRDRPGLHGQPVAVTHARNKEGEADTTEVVGVSLHQSMSDVASCSYEARDFGIRNGMSVGEAINLCPSLTFIPYEFEKYHAVSQTLYETVITYSHLVEPVSCDEVFIEFSDYVTSWEELGDIVKSLRSEIEEKTGCKVSAGFSHNLLLARLATRKAKPNGQFHLSEEEVEGYLKETPVASLPGIGRKMKEELSKMGVSNCGELREVSLPKLREVFGPKTGYTLYCFARGIDNRDLTTKKERKSISVEINYGMRFEQISEAESLLTQLSEELQSRALDTGVLGSSISLKLKIRQKTAPQETKKYLGHGRCDNISRSQQLHIPTNDSGDISRVAISLLKQLSPNPSDIRGMGIALNKLSSSVKGSPVKGGKMADIRTLMTSSPGKRSPASKRSLGSVLKSERGGEEGASVSVMREERVEYQNTAAGDGCTSFESAMLDLPPASQLDQSVLLALPSDLQEEVFDSYSKRQDKERVTLEPVSTEPSLANPLFPPSLSSLSNGNPERFLNETRTHIKAWVALYPAGPKERDSTIFIQFLISLIDLNALEIPRIPQYWGGSFFVKFFIL